MKIRMSAAEIEELKTQLAKVRTFVEFGCGGSTVFALQHSSCMVTSVDSDPDWLERVSSIVAEHRDRLTIHHANIGPTVAWGHPAKPVSVAVAERYHTDVWASLSLNEPSLCLVDGRFRLACALQAKRRLPSGSTILFHDFVGRPHFEKHADDLGVVRTVDSMAIIEVYDPRPDCLDLLNKVAAVSA